MLVIYCSCLTQLSRLSARRRLKLGGSLHVPMRPACVFLTVCVGRQALTKFRHIKSIFNNRSTSGNTIVNFYSWHWLFVNNFGNICVPNNTLWNKRKMIRNQQRKTKLEHHYIRDNCSRQHSCIIKHKAMELSLQWWWKLKMMRLCHQFYWQGDPKTPDHAWRKGWTNFLLTFWLLLKLKIEKGSFTSFFATLKTKFLSRSYAKKQSRKLRIRLSVLPHACGF